MSFLVESNLISPQLLRIFAVEEQLDSQSRQLETALRRSRPYPQLFNRQDGEATGLMEKIAPCPGGWTDAIIIYFCLVYTKQKHVECKRSQKFLEDFRKKHWEFLGALPAEYPTHSDRSRIHFTPIQRPDRIRRKSTIGWSLLSRYLGLEPSIEDLDTELRNGSFSTRYWCKDSWIFSFFPKRYIITYSSFLMPNGNAGVQICYLPSSWHQLACSTARVLQMPCLPWCRLGHEELLLYTNLYQIHETMKSIICPICRLGFSFLHHTDTHIISTYIYIIIGKYVAYDVYLRWSKVDSTRIWLRHGCDAFAWCVSNSGCCLLWNSNSNGPVVIVVFGCHKFMLESIDEVTSKCLSSSPWFRKWGSTSVSLRGQKNIDNIWRISAQKDTNCRIPAQNQGSNKVGDLELNLYMHYSIWILEFVGTGLVQWLHCLGLESGLCSKVMAIMALMIFSLWGTNFRFSWH